MQTCMHTDAHTHTNTQLHSPGLKELRGTVSVSEIVFVGQCEVFVRLDFVLTFFPLAAKLIGPRMVASIL